MTGFDAAPARDRLGSPHWLPGTEEAADLTDDSELLLPLLPRGFRVVYQEDWPTLQLPPYRAPQ
ncbi:hypothetical protein ACWCYY_20115 [Kitasatospora sp. NPDC001664]